MINKLIIFQYLSNTFSIFTALRVVIEDNAE